MPSKRNFFFVFALILVWLCCDAVLFLYLQRLQSYRNIFYGIKIPGSASIEHLKKTFHSRWGWDIKESEKGMLGCRKSRDYPEKALYKMKAFGDSYTFCVTGGNETWEYFIEDKTGWECLNYGVGGYAPDQALLKYTDCGVATDYTIFGILDENIGRLMTNWWGFYHKEGVPVKPRYVIQNGECVFIPNPINHADSLNKLDSIDFLNRLKENDYWHGYYESLDAPEELQWPATFTGVKHFSFFSKHFRLLFKNRFDPSYDSMTESKKFYHLYEGDSDGLKILECIIDEAAAHAAQRGEKLFILLFPIKLSVDMRVKFGRNPYQPVVHCLIEKQITYIDFSEVFKEEEYEKYYDSNGGHLSVKGNERVADEIIKLIN